MPYVPTPEIDTEVPKKERTKLYKLLHERAVLGYAFSYSRLHKLLSQHMDESEVDAALQDCVAAFDDDGKKLATDDLKDKISEMYSELNLSSLRFQDPFHRKLDCLAFLTKSPSRLDRNRAVEIAPKYKVSTDIMCKILDEATTPGKEYATVQIRAVKEKEKK